MLGLGGGVFLVPFLNVALGFPLNVAAGVGLMTVVATSSVVARGTNRGLVNLRLGMILQIAAAAGGYYGGSYAQQIPEHALQLTFAIVTAVIAAIMLSRLERRNVILDTSIESGPFGGRYYEHETGQEVVYRTRRLPAALGVSLVAGSISGLLGIGGGILQVPALNAWCGVPLRAAAATSAIMIGITAAASAPLYYARGDIVAAARRGSRARNVLRLARGIVVRRTRPREVAQDADGRGVVVRVGDVRDESLMTTDTGARETSFERIVSAVMLVVFWSAFSALGAGLILWVATPATDAGALAMAAGLLGLLLMPMLRVVWALATALAERDWLMLGATLTVLAILIALTLRDAATLEH